MDAFSSRIDSREKLKRFSAGSPDRQEIDAYASATLTCPDRKTAIVLGMTPEIRKMATGLFDSIISVDNSSQAISIYAEWLTDSEREKESILKTNWFNLKKYISSQISVIYGDGVFGNLPDIDHHKKLLQLLYEILQETGCLIVRKILIPRNFDPPEESFNQYLHKFRSGIIDHAEFGFGSRILGHYSSCFNPLSYSLDNRKIYAELDDHYKYGRITAEELKAVNRYYFAGNNCILPENVWENLLTENGFSYTIISCSGKDWYRYYKIYRCCKI